MFYYNSKLAYNGYWKNNSPNGEGKLYDINGKKICEESWDNGKDCDGNNVIACFGTYSGEQPSLHFFYCNLYNNLLLDNSD